MALEQADLEQISKLIAEAVKPKEQPVEDIEAVQKAKAAQEAEKGPSYRIIYIH